MQSTTKTATCVASLCGDSTTVAAQRYALHAPVRLIGAELALMEGPLLETHQLFGKDFPETSRDTLRGDVFDSVPIYRTRLLGQTAGFVAVVRAYARHLDSISSGTDEYGRVRANLQKLLAAHCGIERNGESIREFLNQAWDIHRELCIDTVFRVRKEGALTHNLHMLEFNTDFSGLPSQVFPVLRKIDTSLLIDTSLGKQQEGLARTRSAWEDESLLRTIGGRVFVLRCDRETISYTIFLPYPTPSVLPSDDLINTLRERGVLTRESNREIGFVRSQAVRMQERIDFARSGINAAQIMDEVVDEAALVEGCATLVAVVRVGANRNTSIKSHTRRGWERTGIVINEDSEVLIRKLREPTGGASKVVRSAATQADNLIREYLPHMHLDPNDEMALFAPEVPDWWLEGRVRAVAEGWSWCHREARITRQSNGSLEVVFEADRFSICLKQLRRGFDVWECSLLQQAGGLEEFLDYINVWQGLGWQWYAVLSLDAFKR